MIFPDLFGERIDLVSIDPTMPKRIIDDIDRYSRIPEFFEFLEFSEHKSRFETERYYAKLLSRSRGTTGHYWLIKLSKEDKIIGTFGVLDIDVRKGMAEIGYGISPEHWRRGYFHETINLVLHHLFGAAGFHRIWAKTQSDNMASIKGLQTAGFITEGVLRDFYLSEKDGARHDAIVLSILNTADPLSFEFIAP